MLLCSGAWPSSGNLEIFWCDYTETHFHKPTLLFANSSEQPFPDWCDINTVELDELEDSLRCFESRVLHSDNNHPTVCPTAA